MTRFHSGDVVGPYQIVGELGTGGMGVVYHAVHVLLQRPAAIKVLRPELGAVAMASDRFLTEARATTAIRHAGIVEVYDYGHTADGQAFIAMELLRGETLGARLRRRGSLPLPEALAIARQIAAPLAAAHERGIVHRDLKPDNVFLGEERQVKLLDFGIAKLQAKASTQQTTIGLVLGTPSYMAPEQCVGAECDHRTDLYALGCILFEMLAGHAPYSAERTSDLLAAHVRQPIPNVARLVSVPVDVTHLVTTLLAKTPEARPPNAGVVVTEIDRILGTRAPPRRPLRAAIALASGLALSLTTLGAVYRWWRGAPAVDASAPAPTHEAPLAIGTRIMVDTQAPTLPQIVPDAGIPVDAPPPRRKIARPHSPDAVLEDFGSGASGDVDTSVPFDDVTPSERP